MLSMVGLVSGQELTSHARLSAASAPNLDPPKDPKNGPPPKWLHCYIGEPSRLLRGSIIGSFRGSGKSSCSTVALLH